MTKLARVAFVHPVPVAGDGGVSSHSFSDVNFDITLEPGIGIRLCNRRTGSVDYGGLGNIASFRPLAEPPPAKPSADTAKGKRK